MNCSIVLDGFNSQDNIKDIDRNYIIAVDGGIKHLYNHNIIPDVVIGDMDSADSKYINWTKKHDCKVIYANVEKDETDGQLAVDYAIDMGYDFIDFYFFDGGRPDHYIANLFLLKNLLERNIKCRVNNNYGYYFPCKIRATITCRVGTTISILPITNKIILGECSGLKYPILEGFVMNDHNPIGVSNVSTSENVVISLQSGECLIFVFDKSFI